MPPTEIPVRPPVTNAGWDPAAMLAKARAGAYPTATSRRPSGETAKPRGCSSVEAKARTSPRAGPAVTVARVEAVRSLAQSVPSVTWTSAPQMRCSARGSATSNAPC